MSWEPKVAFIEGLHRTTDWYFTNKNREQVKSCLHRMLTERAASLVVKQPLAA
jgi:dTDP-D-glucose 4,6-dehydratase